MKTILFVFLGGGSGSVVRYLFSRLLPSETFAFPLATITANIAASIIAGVLTAVLANQVEGSLRYLLIVGFCGGFSTFSAFSVETIKLFGDGRYGIAFLYIACSLIGCLLGVWMGMFIGKSLP